MISLQKLEKWFFYLFIFCIPFQTRLVLARWNPSQETGFNEWTSAFLYMTDLFIFGLLALWIYRIAIKKSSFGYRKTDFMLFGFLLIFALSISQSYYLNISWYQFAKLAEFAALYFYVRANRDEIFNIKGIAWAISFSGVLQAVIAITQYITQSSLGLRWLGESPLHLPGEGIASFYSGSDLILRPYGTLPHPNLLAAFLLVALVAFVALFTGRQMKSKFWLIGFGIVLYSFFLTYSRTVIAIPMALVTFFSIITLFNKNWRKQLVQYRQQLVTLGFVSIAVVALFLAINYQEVIARIFFSKDDEAVTLRLFYNRVAGKGILARTWLGSGVGTFVPNMMYMLKHIPANLFQPVHNIYLLMLAETGVLGLAFWGLFIKVSIRSYMVKHEFSEIRNIILPFILWAFLIIGLFDHFLWTLQQGRLLFWLALALLA